MLLSLARGQEAGGLSQDAHHPTAKVQALSHKLQPQHFLTLNPNTLTLEKDLQLKCENEACASLHT